VTKLCLLEETKILKKAGGLFIDTGWRIQARSVIIIGKPEMGRLESGDVATVIRIIRLAPTMFFLLGRELGVKEIAVIERTPPATFLD